MKLRIAHCLETVGSGGVEQRRLLLARGLDPKRYEQVLVCTQTVGALPEQIEAAGVPLHRIGRFRGILDPRPYRAALRVMREFRPHIVHGAVYEGVAVAAVCGTLARVPVIIGEETSEPYGRSWKAHLLFRGLLGLATHAVGVSPAVEDYLVHKLRLPRRRVSLITNGVAPPREIAAAETTELRATLGIRDGETVIGIVGRLFDWQKRHSDLLAAFRLLCDRRDDLRLLIVGDGPDGELLQDRAAELGIAGRVIFAGYQADTRPYYTVMDVFALSSLHEAFGLVLVEAMYARLPVVATRAGGIPTIVVDNETGFLVSPSDPPALADRLLALIGDPALRRQFGEAGFARAHQRFSARRYVDDVDRLYQKLAADSQRLGWWN
jgi:glycosyltransferase involved in cell wall biosynthesis